MSTSRKVIKFFSILSIIAGLILVVCGVLFGLDLFDKGAAELAIPVDEAHFDGVLLAVIAGVQGIVQIIIGWIGIKGANQPSKIGTFFIFSLIALIYYAVCFGILMATQGFDAATFVGTLWHLVMVVLANNVKKEAEK